ncbi:MAG: hypothetical protein HYZ57_07690 [Acidobacteria bacterium]|nr:hypothetical protein [Acidobacteriota bacterium]
MYGLKFGPDPRKTGAPGDRTCNESGCHTGTELNGGGGRVELSFEGGNTYTPGGTKRVTVTITDGTARVFGFQASSRPTSDLTNGQAGRFIRAEGVQVICENSQVRTDSGNCQNNILEFIEHTAPRPQGSFTFEWTAPATDVGPVRFFVAGNAANGNDLNTGDKIYTATADLTPGSAPVRPAISQGGVVVASTRASTISSATWIEIYGTNLAGGTRALQGSDIQDGRLPASLDNVSVEVGGVAAFPSFVSPGQVNVLVPDSGDTGTVSVVVINGGQRSDPVSVTKEAISPAFLVLGVEGGKYIAAVHATQGTVIARPDLVPGLTTRAARPGDILSLFAVGFGPTDPAFAAGQIATGIASTTSPVRVRFGDVAVDPTYAGLSPTFAHLYQINVAVPDNVANGDVAVTAEIAGRSTQGNTFITVQR